MATSSLSVPTVDCNLPTAVQDTPAPSSITRDLEALRSREYGRLDDQGHVYLDYTGAGLYAESQLSAHLLMLRRGVFGNPHSTNPTSQAATELAEQARAAVLSYFNADADDYTVVFTPNASGALKLVGEAYPFGAGDRLLLTVDNHNSVNGIREFARARGAATTYVPLVLPDLRVDTSALSAALEQSSPGGNSLFAYPAQSNFSGVQHDLDWIAAAHARGWDVLLDAAAFVPTNSLDLRRWQPDFVPLSFYKMFGYPTGVGCLIARKAALAKLRRPWFAGGTIVAVSVLGDGHFLRQGGEAFEDGTINFLNLPAIEIGLRFLASVGIETIHSHVARLTGWLLGRLSALRYSTGVPLVRLYGPISNDRRGATVAMNFNDARGNLIDFRLVQQRANEVNISLRSGCFCNPGVGEAISGLTQADIEPAFNATSWTSEVECVAVAAGQMTGAVRISLGLPTNFADADRLIQFARGFLA